MNKYIQLEQEYVIQTYQRFPVVLERGEGVYLYDVEGKKYLDFAAGIAVFSLGYHDKELDNVLKNQIDLLIHTSNLFYNKPMALAAEKFCNISGMDRVFFTNSGTEAIEGAIKLARKYYYEKTGNPDGEIIAMKQSFHGRSMGALSVTGQPKYQKAFGPMLSGIKFAEYNKIQSVKECYTEKTCAVILETIQGEGGIHPADREYLQELRSFCDEKDILLILDEIQCGMGRTGTMFAYQSYGVMPDVITSAKALGCGVPVGLFATRKKYADSLKPGDHGTTYGGNPLATAAVCKVLELFEKRKIVEHVKEISEYLWNKLEELKKEYSFIKEIRGKGLMIGIELEKEVSPIITKAREEGLIVISAGTNVIRLVPPLIIEEKHIDEMYFKLKKAFDSMN